MKRAYFCGVETFDNLRSQLELQDWPNVYFFKFIVPSDSEKLAMVTGFFDANAEMNLHPSKTGKFISVSVKMVMMDVDSIIALYERAKEIPGVISL
jgi:hypothetical protein